MIVQPLQSVAPNSCKWPRAACWSLGPGRKPPLEVPWVRRSVVVQAAAAATGVGAAGAPHAGGSRPFWKAALQWWDVGVSENDKNRQPGKLGDTVGMAWQLVAQEKKLMAAASFLMVRGLISEASTASTSMSYGLWAHRTMAPELREPLHAGVACCLATQFADAVHALFRCSGS